MTNNPPAFPITAEVWATHPDFHGMTLRDYFAAVALQGLLATRSGGHPIFYPKDDAEYCYSIANAMLAERSKKDDK